jgi:AraC-like DNA-binding protein
LILFDYVAAVASASLKFPARVSGVAEPRSKRNSQLFCKLRGMTSPARLRKNLLAILEDKLLPGLRGRSTPRLVLAQLPLRVPPGLVVREAPYPPLLESEAARIYPEGPFWEAVQLHAIRFPALFFVFEGEVDFPMGVTTAMLNRLPPRDRPAQPCGGYIISLPAPAFCLFPPGVPQRTGVLPPWHRAEPHIGTSVFLSVRVLPVGALCHLATMHNGRRQNDYSLLVKDNQLAAATNILMDELALTGTDTQVTQALLQTILLRLKRGLSTQTLSMTDGLYSRFPDADPTDQQAQTLHHPTIERAHQFIQLRLHEPLSPSIIAAHVRMTPTQLNNIFKTRAGVSTMNYVAKLRMESAQLLLRTSNLSVQEISQLVGYRQLPHFSRTFQQHTGISPLRFRQQSDDHP